MRARGHTGDLDPPWGAVGERAGHHVVVHDASSFGALASSLSEFGRPVVESATVNGEIAFSVSLYSDGRYGVDDMLQAAWEHGAPDAISVRD